MNRIGLSAGLILLLAAGTATAEERRISKVQKAAIKMMQSKLGTIRGSLKSDSENVFLTQGMIENLKPIRASNDVRPRRTLIRDAEQQADEAIPEAPKKRRVQEVYRAIYSSRDKS